MSASTILSEILILQGVPRFERDSISPTLSTLIQSELRCPKDRSITATRRKRVAARGEVAGVPIFWCLTQTVHIVRDNDAPVQ